MGQSQALSVALGAWLEPFTDFDDLCEDAGEVRVYARVGDAKDCRTEPCQIRRSPTVALPLRFVNAAIDLDR